MNDKNTNRISELKSDVEIAQMGLLEGYFSEIRDDYQKSNSLRRNYLLKKLDSILILKKISTYSAFDHEIASEFRKKSGLTGKELSEKLGGTQGQVSRYESGKRTPSPLMGKFSKNYVKWLKEEGYNPFDL